MHFQVGPEVVQGGPDLVQGGPLLVQPKVSSTEPEKATRQQREIRKKALNFLEHVSGLLNAAAEFDDRVTR